MPGPNVRSLKQKRRMGRKAIKTSKTKGLSVNRFTRRKIAPFASAALKAAKGRSNNQHL
tara:strand:- start:696 stop:872 length:177 start_codon:yes stop_codon:yes gene_type:complete